MKVFVLPKGDKEGGLAAVRSFSVEGVMLEDGRELKLSEVAITPREAKSFLSGDDFPGFTIKEVMTDNPFYTAILKKGKVKKSKKK